MPRVRLVFFSMPFSKKLVGEREHDFDETWRTLLKPAVPPGWEDVRIDEAAQPGPIGEQLKHYLRVADVVVFDLTSANPNVLYELGIRDVFAPGRRVLVARDDSPLPFNLGNERVLRYAADVAQALADGFHEKLTAQIVAAAGIAKDGAIAPPDEARLRAQMERATTLPALVAVWNYWARYATLPVDTLLLLAEAFGKHRRLDLAVAVARRAYAEEPNDWDVARMLGWYLRRNGELEAAGELLQQALALNPRDVESIGMLGGMHKRKALDLLARGSADESKQAFQISKDTYERAMTIDPLDVYNMVNVGALTFITDPTGPNPAYDTVIDLVARDVRGSSTWDLLALGEAYLARGQTDAASRVFADATKRHDFTATMRESIMEQLALLERFGLPSAHATAVRAILVGERHRPGRSLVLIHLSDLHFGTRPDGSEMHRFRTKGPLHARKSLARHIVDECGEYRQDDVGLFVVISGDVAYQAVKDEYDAAHAFYKELVEGLSLRPDQVVIVPGNHDVNWTLSAYSEPQRFDEFLKFVRRVFGRDTIETFYPELKWDFDIDSPRPEAHRILSIHKAPDDGIVFVGFNSCVVEDNKRHFGAIGRRQLDLATQALADVDPAWLRIAVMHHHVLPLESQLSTGDEGTAMDGTIVRDFAVLEKNLHDLRFDMVLHGHKHEPGVRVSKLVNAFGPDGGKSIVVCGAGSAGVEAAELPHGRGNHFAIYRIPQRTQPGPLLMEVEWRELPYDDVSTKWVSTGRWTVRG